LASAIWNARICDNEGKELIKKAIPLLMVGRVDWTNWEIR